MLNKNYDLYCDTNRHLTIKEADTKYMSEDQNSTDTFGEVFKAAIKFGLFYQVINFLIVLKMLTSNFDASALRDLPIVADNARSCSTSPSRYCSESELVTRTKVMTLARSIPDRRRRSQRRSVSFPLPTIKEINEQKRILCKYPVISPMKQIMQSDVSPRKPRRTTNDAIVILDNALSINFEYLERFDIEA
jgi:hypothetical protein